MVKDSIKGERHFFLLLSLFHSNTKRFNFKLSIKYSAFLKCKEIRFTK